ncbi:MAG: class I SAM-dependent methyltransferase [Terricaulis sp.]
MPDPIFSNPRLADIYDLLDPDRTDLDVYLAIVEEFEARSVLDIGCGTGTFACMLAGRGIDVTGVDPANASLDVARQKQNARRVRWVLGDASRLPPIQVDMATMTGNVAQVFLTDADWSQALRGIHSALRPHGRLIFEVRNPAKQAWRDWNREKTYRRTNIAGVGAVETWCDVTSVVGDLVAFRWTHVFESDGATVSSDSVLRFRRREEVEFSLEEAGYALQEVRDALDRPGLEFVFVAERCEKTTDWD